MCLLLLLSLSSILPLPSTLLYDFLFLQVRFRLLPHVLELQLIQILLDGRSRVGIAFLPGAQRQSPLPRVLLVPFIPQNLQNLHVHLLLLVRRQRRLRRLVPQVIQPRLRQQREPEPAQPQVIDPLQAVASVVLQRLLERGHRLRLPHQQEPTRQASRAALRLLRQILPAGIRRGVVARRQREPPALHVLLRVRRRACGYVGAVGSEIAAAVCDGTHPQIVLLERGEETQSILQAAERTLLLITRKPVRAKDVVVDHFEERKHDGHLLVE